MIASFLVNAHNIFHLDVFYIQLIYVLFYLFNKFDVKLNDFVVPQRFKEIDHVI